MNCTEGYTTKAEVPDSGAVLLLAHGAGAPADSGFMERLASALARHGVTVVRFEFPYMQKRREDGRKRPPDRADTLLASFREQIDRVRAGLSGNQVLFIGGKSMGGRMASMLASEPQSSGMFAGTLCFGYPFHPPGKPDKLRVGHFAELWAPVCILQGTRDPFGKLDEVADLLTGERPVEMHWLDGGNHDFTPLKRSGKTQQELIEQAAWIASEFMKTVVVSDASPA